MIPSDFWKNKKVLVTGHTGFKGSWLSLWLHELGAKVAGFSLEPPTDPNHFDLLGLKDFMESRIGDIRDLGAMKSCFEDFQPEIVFHLAAQPLVRESYKSPVDTYSTNVMGSLNIMEAVRDCSSVKVLLMITTDKCYENREWHWGYREDEPMGGHDPYSSSKGCAEIAIASYRRSFFNEEGSPALASARAGNVIGGGDWARDRLIPDCIKSWLSEEKVVIRNPGAVRPWQHVLEPLCGYLKLSQKLYSDKSKYSGAWNFGPNESDALSVAQVLELLKSHWKGFSHWEVDEGDHPHEAHYLKLDCSKAKAELGFTPRWSIGETMEKIAEWYQAYSSNISDVVSISKRQISEYSKA